MSANQSGPTGHQDNPRLYTETASVLRKGLLFPRLGYRSYHRHVHDGREKAIADVNCLRSRSYPSAIAGTTVTY